MHEADIHDRITYLRKFVTDKRYETLSAILARRTRHLTVALEDVYHPHNASAVLRSCDCFGVQDVHVIENKNRLNISAKVTKGAESWLTINKYAAPDRKNSEECMKVLRKRGYRIMALTPHQPDCELGELHLEDRLALFFGTEKEGLSEYVLDQADQKVSIPMYGFTESFNISVSVALVLYDLRIRLDKSDIAWKLSQPEKETLLLDWLRYSIRAGELIEQREFTTTTVTQSFK